MKKSHQATSNDLLRQAREQRNWSQETLAAQLGTSTRTVSRWERGVSRPTPHFRELLCRVFDLSAPELGLLPLVEAAAEPTRQSLSTHTGDRALHDPAIPLMLVDPAGLVGRDTVLGELKGRLADGNSVVLTALNGLPGVGKTTLAVTLARDAEVREHYADGVLWVGLGPRPNVLGQLARWGGLLGVSVAEAARESSSGETWAQALQMAIGGRRMLLVIDDAWELEQAKIFKLGGPNCAYLLTTRFPTIATLFTMDGMTVVEELSVEDGLALLTRLAPRAVRAEPAAARDLVRAVGGLPLAITLMGHDLRVQSLGEQPRRIADAVAQLRQARHRLALAQPQGGLESHTSLLPGTPLSLQAVIGTSVAWLAEDARAALYALAAFPAKPNTFSEEAACAVAACAPPMLYRLNDAGLLESRGNGRHCLHQTIADYAALSNSGAEGVKRLSSFMATYVEDHVSDLVLLEKESENVLAAAQGAFEQNRLIDFVRIVNGFAHFLEARGMTSLAEHLLERAQGAAQEVQDPGALAGVLLHRGRMSQRRGDYTQAETYYQSGLVCARQSQDRSLVCQLLRNLGVVADSRGEYGQAEAFFQEGLGLARQIADIPLIIVTLHSLGIQMIRRNAIESAESYYVEALSMARELDDRERICFLLAALADAEGRRGHLDQAESYVRDSLDLARQLGHSELIGGTLANLGAIVRDQGRLDQAEAYLLEALDLLRQLGHHWILISALLEMGELQLKRQHYPSAHDTFREVIEITPEGNQELVAAALYGQARVAAALGDVAQARRCAAESLWRFESIGHGEATQVRNWLSSLSDLSTDSVC